MLPKLAIPHLTTIVYYDNLNVVNLAHNPVLHANTKHMELELLLRERRFLPNSLSSSILLV